MEIAAIIIVIGSAAFGAAAGLGGAWVYERYRQLPWQRYWFGAGGGVAGLAISVMVLTGWPLSFVRSIDQVPLDQVTPYMSILKPRDPASVHKSKAEAGLYERVTTLVSRDREDGRSEDEVRANAMSQILSYAADKVVLMPDDIVYEYYAFSRDELAHLDREQDHAVCADLALGRTRGDIEGFLSEELVERQRNIISRILQTKPSLDVALMASEPFSVVAAQAFAGASQATGIPPNEIEVLLGGGGEPRKLCKLMKGFFDVLLAQPVEAAAPALRALAAGERSG
jgi:hypothetical protein